MSAYSPRFDSTRDRAIFQLAYRAGLRASEVGLLQLRDYDPKADRIFIHRLKGSNSGEHHLVREEARALRAWLKVRGSYPGPIFLSKQKRPIDRSSGVMELRFAITVAECITL